MLHGTLMMMTGSLIAAGTYFFYSANSKGIIIYFQSFTIIDFMSEVIVCYICYSMGSDRNLKDFDCLIITNSSGDLVLKFLPKNDFKQ